MSHDETIGSRRSSIHGKSSTRSGLRAIPRSAGGRFWVWGLMLVALGTTPLICAADGALPGPDPARGGLIAARGENNVPACGLCHALDGSADPSGAFPRIGGQSATYLSKEMRDFASGTRMNALMTPIAANLSPEDRENVAAYYAAAQAPFPAWASPDPSLITRGEQLARSGDPEKQIPSCQSCHGVDGIGAPPTTPYLAGQYRQYITFELRMWQRGYRRNSQGQMEGFTAKLDDRDISSVSAYFQQLSPPLAPPAVAIGKN